MNNINLLPSKYKNKNMFKNIVYVLVVLFLIITGILFSLIYQEGLKQELLNSNLAIIKNEINSLNDLVVLAERLQKIKKDTSSLKSAYQQGKLYESKILNIVETVMPQNMKVKAININNDGQVEMLGCIATSYEMVVELLKNIKDVSLIQNLKISSIVKSKTAESVEVKDSFPKRGSEYISIGDITTTDFFKDNYAFSITFLVRVEAQQVTK
ncbi:hypothetical protein IMX26_03575 [Clostridium sp. 'deep sea']|uniref:PilN domain-containing protein n=1 Tax=Clostridium sp. 'deep sea' TaxID=2779445 RepID=UPI0018964778|nr:hypothetical protein [Clostridium sp. 'deep sea']QOR35910.1 hypothetical protein IMX26_03575 [Clostridium sp. 'deep sea']